MISWFKDIPLSSKAIAFVLSPSSTIRTLIPSISFEPRPTTYMYNGCYYDHPLSPREHQPKHSAVNTKLSPLVLLYFSNQDNVGNVFVNTLSNGNERE